MKSVLLKHSNNSFKILPKLHVGPLHPDGHEAVVVVEIEVEVVIVVVFVVEVVVVVEFVVVVVVVVVVLVVVVVVIVVVVVVVVLGADVVCIHSDLVDRLQVSPVQPSNSKQRQRSG